MGCFSRISQLSGKGNLVLFYLLVFSCNDFLFTHFSFLNTLLGGPLIFQMDWMMILKSLNKNLMNLEKKVPLMGGGAGKGVLAGFVISKPSPSSYICRLTRQH